MAVFLSIPLSVLATFLALGLAGSSVNTMILGGLALALSRLIDNSVVVLENIFRHIELGESPEAAAEKGGREMALPVLAATLTTVIVFFPVTFLYGVSRFLFIALALAVVLSLFASYVVALTVVPLFCAKLIRLKHHAPGEEGAPERGFTPWFNRRFAAMLDRYDGILKWALARPLATVVGILAVFGLSLCLFPWIGVSYFPRTDPGQFVVNLKAPTGMRVEVTEQLIAQVEKIIREEVAPEELDVIVANLGVQPGFSAIYTSNSGQHTATVQVSLKTDHKIGSYAYMERIRGRLRVEVPQLNAYFQSGGMVDAVLNLGLPAPIDIQITGSDLDTSHRIASEIARRARLLPGVSDVLVPQDIDQPSFQLVVNRANAAELGLSTKEIIQNVITALASASMIAPSYFVDPVSGNDYILTVQYPENRIHDLNDVLAIPIRGPKQSHPARLDSICSLRNSAAPTEVDHYQIRRVMDVYVAPSGEDLGQVVQGIRRILAETQIPSGVRITMRGMVQGMESSFRSFGLGLILSVVLVYLILVAQFQSWIDPFLILLAVPAGLAGVLAILFISGTTMNVMSLMGVVMMVGIVVSNSILIVEFTRRLREEGHCVRDAVALACRVRLRPVLMTSLATLFGLLPMALKLGTGGEAYAPLARTIIGGLGVSVLLTVFIVPAAYLLAHRERPLGPTKTVADSVTH